MSKSPTFSWTVSKTLSQTLFRKLSGPVSWKVCLSWLSFLSWLSLLSSRVTCILILLKIVKLCWEGLQEVKCEYVCLQVIELLTQLKRWTKIQQLKSYQNMYRLHRNPVHQYITLWISYTDIFIVKYHITQYSPKYVAPESIRCPIKNWIISVTECCIFYLPLTIILLFSAEWDSTYCNLTYWVSEFLTHS